MLESGQGPFCSYRRSGWVRLPWGMGCMPSHVLPFGGEGHNPHFTLEDRSTKAGRGFHSSITSWPKVRPGLLGSPSITGKKGGKGAGDGLLSYMWLCTGWPTPGLLASHLVVKLEIQFISVASQGGSLASAKGTWP